MHDVSSTRSAALIAVVMACSTAFAQPTPSSEGAYDKAPGAPVRIPITMPRSTEVMGTENVATPPPIAIEEPIAPEAYVCGPGDQFELNFWGTQNFRLRFAADLEGRTFISKIGYVDVAGKTLKEARAQILKKVSVSYPRLQFDLALVEPRAFLVHVAGNVKTPGSLQARAMERVSNVVSRAGGLTGSKRRISIARKGVPDLTADLVLYELTGDTRYNPYVLDGDVISVPFAATTVAISGAVRRPGTYELIGTKDLAELLQLAGGLTTSAPKNLPIRLVRKNASHQAVTHELAFTGGATPNEPLLDEDTVQVRGADEMQRTVLLIGAVAAADNGDPAAASSRLPFVEGDTVLSLLDRAGGLKAPGDLRRAYITRVGQDGTKMTPIDLQALLVRRDFRADKPLEVGDTIVVPPLRHSILVEGAVSRAGSYSFNPAFGAPEYIALAGGRTRTAEDMDEVRLVEENGKTRPYRAGMKLNPGDTVLVPERSYTRTEIVQITLSAASIVLTAVAIGVVSFR